jgi:hypothetical protein
MMEGRNLTLEQKISTLEKMITFAVTSALDPVEPEVARRRYRVCQNCVIYDWKNNRCRSGSYGCGCYVPYLVATSYDPCWGRQQNEDIGWT